MEKVAIAMSGGVDSSTAALILKKSGYDLIGFSMQLWDQRRSGPTEADEKAGRCCSLDDLHDAREVAARLNIPYYVVNFQKEFEDAVVRPFVEDYRCGRTPSPCVLCNSRMKFDHLVRMAEEIQASKIATGHYARIARDEISGRWLLIRARDENKDQSYFLFELSQSQLAKALFPLGELVKEQVRQIARQHNVLVAEKAESQEICFVPDGDYASFVERYHDGIPESIQVGHSLPGNIIDSKGQILGTHAGIHHFTIGQRRGLGIAHSEPLYVLEIRPEDCTVVVGERSLLGKRSCHVQRLNWISIPDLHAPLRVTAKIRSRHPAAAAEIFPMEDGSVNVSFDAPQNGISPGQACVFYQGETVVGGGWISRD
jgi:tRNA-uridine 2-sulfurtransferase